MRKIVFALCLLVSLSANAKDCEQEESMSAIRACEESQNESGVESAFSSLINALGKNNDAILAIKQSQSDWKQFRDSSCEYVGLTDKNGGYKDDAILNCKTDFNKARVKILNGYVKAAKANN